MRFSENLQEGVRAAFSAILNVNPFGNMAAKQDAETPLWQALSYGASQGAKCTFQALEVARKDGVFPARLFEQIEAAMTFPMFTALCGKNPDAPSLRAGEGLTYIKVGSISFDIASLAAVSLEAQNMDLRIQGQLLRNIAQGSIAALQMRQGVAHFDEAWTLMGTQSGKGDLNAMGRLARSMQVMPVLYTQKVTDAVEAGLAGAIGQTVILSLQGRKLEGQDMDQAEAACMMAGIEATPSRLARIRAGAEIGTSKEPNPLSLKALHQVGADGRRQMVRGSVALFVDAQGQTAYVEVRVPDELAKKISTNAQDLRERAAQLAVQPADDSNKFSLFG